MMNISDTSYKKQMIKKPQQKQKIHGQSQNFARKIFTALTIIGLIGQIVFFADLLHFRRQAQTSNIYILSFSSLFWCLLSVVINLIIRKYYTKYVQSFFSSKMHPRSQFYTQQQKLDRLVLITRQSFDIIYHLAVSIFMIVVFRHESWFPIWLGGSGTCNNLIQEYPSWSSSLNPTMEIFVMLQLGTNVYLLLDLVWFSREYYKDKENGELLFHHIITIILTFSAFQYNFMQICITVFFVHDLSDVFRALSRMLGQSKLAVFYSRLTISMDILYLIIWGYLRIAVFPFCLIVSIYQNIPNVEHPFHFVSEQFYCLIALLLILFFLQMYWFYFLKQGCLKQWKQNKQMKQHWIAQQNKKQIKKMETKVEKSGKKN